MNGFQKLIQSKTFFPVLVSLALMLALFFLPTGYEGALSYQNADRVPALVLSTDESDIYDTGLVRTGDQRCRVRILGGQFAGTEVDAVNRLSGSLAQDKLFSAGEKAFVVVSHSGDAITTVYMTDHFRLGKEALLAGLFLLLLLIFARGTGLRAILSFIDTILLTWKVLVPSLLNGYKPIWVSLGLVMALTALILMLIYGWDRRFLAAVSGAALGILVTAVLGAVFTNLFQIHGAVMESSESLLYAGYQHLDLTKIFIASIFLGSSGAVMDLSVDICSAVYEVVQKSPTSAQKKPSPPALRSAARPAARRPRRCFWHIRAAISSFSWFLWRGHAGGADAELQICRRRDRPYHRRLVRSCHRRAADRHHERLAPDTRKKDATASRVQRMIFS